ncbi:MAG TPA: hypothetical protein VFT95_16145 [Micromonosporaceae bacterium]|nr:hypothetical protein [Micromonosporaceae bacterium]
MTADPPDRLPRLRWPLATVLAVVAAALALALGLRDRGPEDPGVDNARIQMVELIEALEDNDAAALARVIGQPRDSAEVTRRLAAYGGRDLRPGFTVENEFPGVYRVTVDGGGGVRFVEVLEWEGGRWHFAPFTPPNR